MADTALPRVPQGAISRPVGSRGCHGSPNGKTTVAKKGEKVGKGDGRERWTVRGVPSRLQKSAGDAARARGVTLGQWLSEVLVQATAGTPRPAAVAAEWEKVIEERLARLEAASAEGKSAPAAAPGRHASLGHGAGQPAA